jgi:hypothetical protein
MTVKRPPDSGTYYFESGVHRERAWEPIPLKVLLVWLFFFGVFLYELARDGEMPRLIDNLFMMIHEAGHSLFRILGLTPGVAGGTLLQLFVPFALAFYFVRRRQPQGTALCTFFFFEQFVPISNYMADAQARKLPLFTLGNYEHVIHDWNYLFAKLGILSYDRAIAGVVHSIGCFGMIGVAFWLLWRFLSDFR